MSVKLIHLPDEAKAVRHSFWIVDDFIREDANLWTDLETDAGASAAVAAVFGGALRLTTGGVDNNEAARYSRTVFQFAVDKPIQATGRVKYTEANVDDANFFFGLSSGLGADFMLDNGGGVKAGVSCAGFYKIDGENRYHVRTAVGATVKDTIINVTAGGGAWHTLRIEVETSPDGSEVWVTYLIDTSGGYAFKQPDEYGADPRVPLVRHKIAIGSPALMAAAFYAKAGGANSEVIDFDDVEVYQTR